MTPRVLARMVERAFPGARVAEALLLADGFRNSNFKLLFEGAAEPMVLRVYRHDPALCRKELDLIRFLAGSVPVPEVIHAEPSGSEDLPPFVLMPYVEGITFRELRRGGDREAIAQGARSWRPSIATRFRNRVGSVRVWKSLRRCWKAPMPCRDSWICAWLPAICRRVCRRPCAIASIA